MNTLFEKFIFHMIKRQEEQFKEDNLYVSPQIQREFWGGKPIRPDILIAFKKAKRSLKIILDTKWKVVKEGSPADDDLKQMYTYNMHFGSDHDVLLYPFYDQKDVGKIAFDKSSRNFWLFHSCEIYFIDLFENGTISEQKIRDLWGYLIKTKY